VGGKTAGDVMPNSYNQEPLPSNLPGRKHILSFEF
jgi:hypothetical protein